MVSGKARLVERLPIGQAEGNPIGIDERHERTRNHRRIARVAGLRT